MITNLVVKMKPERVENILEQCAVLGKNSKCSRRQFGAIITDSEGTILSAGWNGSARGTFNCGTEVKCIKDLFNVPSYQGYEMCPAVHSEENAINNAARNGARIKDGWLFINASEEGTLAMPCNRCRRAIINAGISHVIFKNRSGETIFISRERLVEEENLWIKEQEKIGLERKDTH